MNTILLQNVSWSTYQALLAEAGESARFTYDRGCLEIEMSPLPKHEGPKRLLEIIVELICEEREIPFVPLGSVTFSREKEQQGCEPDSSYLIRPQATTPVDFTDLDPTTTTPDLVIEVDVTSPSVDKDSIYAAMGVQELWRWRGTTATIFTRSETGFQRQTASQLLSGVTSEDIQTFVGTGKTTPQLTWRKDVRRWARGL